MKGEKVTVVAGHYTKNMSIPSKHHPGSVVALFSSRVMRGQLSSSSLLGLLFNFTDHNHIFYPAPLLSSRQEPTSSSVNFSSIKTQTFTQTRRLLIRTDFSQRTQRREIHMPTFLSPLGPETVSGKSKN